MASSKNPFGFLPARKRDGQPNTEGYGQIVQPVSNSAIGIVSLLPNDIYAGDLIVIDTAGTITPLASTSLKPSGVFQGCQYVENGEPKFSRHFPGGTCVTDVKLHVITDPAQTYFVQADGILSDGEFSIAWATTLDLISPQAIIIIRLAFIIVPIPMVMALIGTFSSPKKSLAASILVIESKFTNRVIDSDEEPGSLNPICPVLPIPRI